MRGIVHSVISILVFVVMLALPEKSNAWAGSDGGGDGGCCVSDSIVVSMGEAYGVSGSVTLGMMERLSEETFADLRLLQSTPTEACAVYRVCDEMPDEFFRILLGETIERFKAAELKASQRQAFVFTLLTACVAVASFLLSVFSIWLTHRRSKSG